MDLEINWKDKHLSINEVKKDNKVTRLKYIAFKNLFGKLLLFHSSKRFEKYKIHLTYNSRLDPTNCALMIKIFEDMMTKRKIIKDDTKRYCRGIYIEPDESMGSKEYKIVVKSCN